MEFLQSPAEFFLERTEWKTKARPSGPRADIDFSDIGTPELATMILDDTAFVAGKTPDEVADEIRLRLWRHNVSPGEDARHYSVDRPLDLEGLGIWPTRETILKAVTLACTKNLEIGSDCRLNEEGKIVICGRSQPRLKL